jgi:hypothetical protein
MAEALRVHTVTSSTVAFQRFSPHLLVPALIPSTAENGIHDVDIMSPLFRHCKLLCQTGGCYHFHKGGCSAVAGFRLVHVQAVIQNIHGYNGYAARRDKLTRLRREDGGLFNANTSLFTAEQLCVLSLLRQQFHERPPGTESRAVNSFYCFHGPRREHLQQVCLNGMVATKGMDDGYFGSGCYATLNIEYALRYVYGDLDEDHGFSRRDPPNDDRYPVIMFAASTGMAYPITREVDYGSSLPSSSSSSSREHDARCKYFGCGLKGGFDCHVICVNEAAGFQAVPMQACQYVEVVMDQETSLLPVAVLWFEKN